MYPFSQINLFSIIYDMSDITSQQFVFCWAAFQFGQKIPENTSDNCLKTQAKHLEVAGDSSKDSFNMSLTRFILWWENISIIFLDSDTNLVDAEWQLGVTHGNSGLLGHLKNMLHCQQNQSSLSVVYRRRTSHNLLWNWKYFKSITNGHNKQWL